MEFHPLKGVNDERALVLAGGFQFEVQRRELMANAGGPVVGRQEATMRECQAVHGIHAWGKRSALPVRVKAKPCGRGRWPRP
jgi:hypothetical protein